MSRPRHKLPAALVALLAPLFRYSPSRDAWVLRAIGNSRGPVIVRRGR